MSTLRTIVLGLVIGLSSCVSLDEEPKGVIAPENFYTTAADLQATIIACYGNLGDFDNYYGRPFYVVTDITSDDTDPGRYSTFPERIQLNTFTHAPNNENLRLVWRNIYRIIAACNQSITYGSKIQMDATEKKQAMAQAHFLRAMQYFNAVRLWGDIPLTTAPIGSIEEALTYGRAPVAQVYDQIVADLRIAETDLPITWGNADIGRATKGAAKGMLAKVLLTQEKWAEARDKAKEVMDMGVYRLLPDYEKVWREDNENNAEFLFSIQNKGGTTKPGRWRIQMLPTNAGGYGNNVPDTTFYNWFPDHYRKDISFLTSYINGNVRVDFQDWRDNRPHVGKWQNYGPASLTATNTDVNYPVMRYSEVLLIYAEAAAHAAGAPTPLALDAINQVRKRARTDQRGVENRLALPDLRAGLTLAEFDDKIIDERRMELCFEQCRWFDLIRKPGYFERYLVPIGAKQYNRLFPLPALELTVMQGKLQQNQGY
jgi:hypothetical protein